MRHGEGEKLLSKLKDLPKRDVMVEEKQRTLEQILSFEERWTKRENGYQRIITAISAAVVVILFAFAIFTQEGRQITAGIWEGLLMLEEKEAELELVEEPLLEDESQEVDNRREFMERTIPLRDAEYELLWPDKTKLVWLVDTSITHRVDPEVFIRFNDRLVEKGASFVVQFVGHQTDNIEQYQNMLRGKMERKEQVDLINTGYGVSGVDRSTFPDAVEDGLLEPLDSYLSEGIGVQLYEAFAPIAWSGVTQKGEIYGVESRYNLSFPTYLFINKQLVEQKQIKLPERLERVEQLEELLLKVNEMEYNEKSIYPLAFGLPDAKRLSQYVFLDSGIAVGYGNDGVPRAVNPFDDEEVVSLLRYLNNQSEKGLVAKYLRNSHKLYMGQFFAYISDAEPRMYHDGVLNVTYGSYSNQIEVYEVKLQDDYYIPTPNAVNGLASWSEHKQEAFQLLVMLNTDAELSNLLRHGIEGKQYIMSGQGMVRNEGALRAPGLWAPANHLLTHPTGLEPKHKEEWYWEMAEDLQISPIAGFSLDDRAIKNELTNIKAIYEKYKSIWEIHGVDVESLIEEANQELAKAQMDKVLAEINKQLRAWWMNR